MDNTTQPPSGFDPNAYLGSAATPAPVLDATPTLDAAPIEPSADSSLFTRAVVYGVGGAAAGGAVYAAFILITNITIGYLAILVAWLVAKAMMIGSHDRGGRKYQVTAILLTVLAVGMGNAIILYRTTNIHPHSLIGAVLVVTLGIIAPFLEFTDNVGGALIDLFILFIGLRAAWRMTSDQPNSARHPFSR